MHYSSILLALAATASAKTWMITVGADDQLAFKPNNIKATAGDKLMFMFYPQNHSVAMGTFDKPCQPMSANAAFSGYVPVTAQEKVSPKAFEVNVQNTETMWFYCTQTDGGHCQHGMSMVVNPTSSATLQEYQAKSKKATTVAPSQKGGGSWVTMGGSSSGNSSSSGKPSGAGSAAGTIFANGGLVAGVAGAAAYALL